MQVYSLTFLTCPCFTMNIPDRVLKQMMRDLQITFIFTVPTFYLCFN